jgi:putative Holliday junction resolvase
VDLAGSGPDLFKEIPSDPAADLLDESGTYGSRRKEILDSVSATVILEDYLAWRKEHPGEI